jgi:hypothetical protein
MLGGPRELTRLEKKFVLASDRLLFTLQPLHQHSRPPVDHGIRQAVDTAFPELLDLCEAI